MPSLSERPSKPVMPGLDGMAKTLAAVLDERRRARTPDNVVDLHAGDWPARSTASDAR
ncbi:MAG: hypothetical protein ABTD50_23560 [Polyangiaceae bacterium]|jgi:hypothetical protein